uniref:Olfactory receptor n=1 Tax=Pelusios castaneus TaxID=367368 RepID=A0A8C8RXA6_9SAUR
MQWKNQTTINKFLLLGFGNLNEVQILLFVLFLVIYMMTIAGNLLIVMLIVADYHLHTPMYFFLGNLSFLETCYTSVTAPRLLAGFLVEDRTISFRDCITQLYFFSGFACIECFLLAVMAYDRYLAICNPLSYNVRMNFRVCLQLASASWITGFLATAFVVAMVPQLSFCGPNEINNFFCDMEELLKLSCTKSSLVEVIVLFFCSLVSLLPFLFIVVSYIFILSAILRIASSSGSCFLFIIVSYVQLFTTVLRMPSEQGRHKAFSTCLPHLTVVSLFVCTSSFTYLKPTSNSTSILDLMVTVLYSVVPPLTNPIIYTMRNKEIKAALRKMIGWRLFTKH